jgi:hypothetical protein|nr:MAG TPA: tail assembly chaperone protein [Caudoviricetes sp.]
MEQKTFEYKDNIYRIRKMNAIEALALRSASDMKSVAGAKQFFTDVLERIEVQAGEKWLPVKQENANVYLPDGIQDDFTGVQLLIEFFMKEFLTPFFEKSVE